MKRLRGPLALAACTLLATACSNETEPGLASTPSNRPAANCAVSLWPEPIGGHTIRVVEVKTTGPGSIRVLGTAVLRMPDAVTLTITPVEPLTSLPDDGITTVDLDMVTVRLSSQCSQPGTDTPKSYTTHPNMIDSGLITSP